MLFEGVLLPPAGWVKLSFHQLHCVRKFFHRMLQTHFPIRDNRYFGHKNYVLWSRISERRFGAVPLENHDPRTAVRRDVLTRVERRLKNMR